MNLLPQVGFFEIIVVAVVALVVIGPRDLPKLMRMAGKMAAKARRMAGEFRSAFDQMARESEMEEMRKEIEALKKNNAVAETRRSVENAVKPVETLMRDEANEVRDAMARRPETDKAPAGAEKAE